MAAAAAAAASKEEVDAILRPTMSEDPLRILRLCVPPLMTEIDDNAAAVTCRARPKK